ncbi:hypothetical protein [Actinoplanes couchii]|uniref:YbaB/EbfC DNA-binding family protein n=1 Tax=Actinoplanes couchii TaxID=403638 RepID=A0ABQ3WZK2_9ACTN|nr:hypothetical protein [Actinoplanes couchii]MDR6316034.1 DNA-binding protein YbaB [Actinoplanes couchii]GID51647.1 hypothetical protein Aco03nite_000510 [Actinoplanes couchii]
MIGNPAEEFAEFQRRFLTNAQRATAGQAAASGISASDSSGTVTVSLNSDGQVGNVRLTMDAKHVLGPAGIGPSVIAAVQAASTARLTAWAEAYTDDDATRPSHSVVGSASPGAGLPAASPDGFAAEFERLTTGRNLDSAGVRDAMYELLGLLERVDRSLDVAAEQARIGAAARHIGVSSDRHVRVMMTGAGELVDVHCDSRWLREAHEINIGRQITSAFHGAYQTIARDGVAVSLDDKGLGQLRNLLQDPARLAQMLRLGD